MMLEVQKEKSTEANRRKSGQYGMYEVDWLLNEEKGFVLYFRPRCGSTTATRWFFENMGVKFGGFSIAAFRNEWLEPRLDDLQEFLDENYSTLHKFVIVRDPFDRAVSSYLHAVNNPRDYQWDVIKPYFPEYTEKHDLTFRQFVEFLHKDNLDRTTIIWRRQSVLSCWERGVDDVVLLENLNDYLILMNARFRLDATPGFNSVTVFEKDKKKQCDNEYADVPFKELLKFKQKNRFTNFPDYSCFYDERLRQDIEELYKDDLRVYRENLPEKDGILTTMKRRLKALLNRNTLS